MLADEGQDSLLCSGRDGLSNYRHVEFVLLAGGGNREFMGSSDNLVAGLFQNELPRRNQYSIDAGAEHKRHDRAFLAANLEKWGRYFYTWVFDGVNGNAPAWRILTLLIPFANVGFGVNIFLTINPRFMASSPKPAGPKSNLAKDLWINPRSNLRGPDGDRAWDNLGNISPQGGARFLELADIALGLKRSAIKKKKTVITGAHQTNGKTEPYSR